MRIDTYQEALKRHLTHYKQSRLGVIEDGPSCTNGQPKGHILPRTLYRQNILEGYRTEFWDFWAGARSKLHDGFHHLNSSQAMCFNLFFPLVVDSEASILIPRSLGLGSEQVSSTAFEKIPDSQEQTNFDFYIELESGRRIFVEMKLSESHFGSTKGDERRLNKLRDIYMARLQGKVLEAALIPKTFFKNYQLLRSVSFLRPTNDDLLLLVFPQANAALTKGVRFLEEHLSPGLDTHVKVLYIEDILRRIRSEAGEPLLQVHYQAFEEKYIIGPISG